MAELAALAGAAGLGGVVGAIATVVSTGLRLTAAWTAFSTDFRRVMNGRTDPDSESLRVGFQEFEESIQGLDRAVKRLRRALKLK